MTDKVLAAGYCTRVHLLPKVAERTCRHCRAELQGTRRLTEWLDEALLVWTHADGDYRSADPGGDTSAIPGRPLIETGPDTLVLPHGATDLTAHPGTSVKHLTVERIHRDTLTVAGINPDELLASIAHTAGVPTIRVNGHLAGYVRDIVTLETATPGSLQAALDAIGEFDAPRTLDGRMRLTLAFMASNAGQRLEQYRHHIEAWANWALPDIDFKGTRSHDEAGRLVNATITWLVIARIHNPDPEDFAFSSWNLRPVIQRSHENGDDLINAWHTLTPTERDTAIKLANGWEGTMSDLLTAAKHV